MSTTKTFERDEKAADDDEQKWNSQTNGNYEDQKQR